MSEKRVVPDTEENAGRCRCPACLTHNKCMFSNKEHLFCSRGNTDCDPKKYGCMCPACPIWAEYKLTDYYYCIEGAAKK